jgi:acetyltransferase-like isoleucine patch superfamily enzyme
MSNAETRTQIPNDWFALGMPSNVSIGKNVYIDSSYGFAAVASRENPAIIVGDCAGVYDRAAFIVGSRGKVTVGAFTVLNGTYIICDERVDIGSHCLLSWGVAISDNWMPSIASVDSRRSALESVPSDSTRHQPASGKPRPVVIEDNVWVGFDAVIMPGVTLGRGSIIGARSIVRESIPPYAIVVGDPTRIIRYIDPDDTDEARADALANLVRAT